MGIHHAEVPIYWNYFLSLEDDIEKLARWIEFSPHNYATYSIELGRLLMTASAEADVVAKALCKRIDAKAKAAAIGPYQRILVEAVPALPTVIVTMPRYGLRLTPWENWQSNDTPPLWWTGNNKVKHHRGEHFHAANLKNVLNAVAGLLLLLLLYYGGDRQMLKVKPRICVPGAFGIMQDDGLLLSVPPGLPWG